jgi:DNA adenine methylase
MENLALTSELPLSLPLRIHGKQMKEKEPIKPILKWAGGKSQILNELLKYCPTKFNKYIEPFVGGGALFFSLAHPYSIISDLNEELIITYQQIQSNVEEVISILTSYRNEEDFFYQVRAQNVNRLSYSERAARLIFLNKTCFNGLYRVNKSGEFNVPYGKRKSSFLNEQSLILAASYLQKVTIIHSDYKSVLNEYAREGDFIFLDPPYQPVGKYSDFKRYTKEFFYENNQKELSMIFKQLVDQGCFVILTNSNHPSISELYIGYKQISLTTKRLISCDSKTRQGVDLIILGGI